MHVTLLHTYYITAYMYTCLVKVQQSPLSWKLLQQQQPTAMVATSTVGVLLVLCAVLGLALSSHFMGAIIQWKPESIGSDGTVTIEISHQASWKGSSSNICGNTTVSGSTLLGEGALDCRVGCSGNVGSMLFYCTDYSISEDWKTGSRSYDYTFASGITQFEASFKSGNWISEVGGGNWEIRVKGDLSIRADTHSINNSPVSGTRPIVKLKRGCSMRIPVSDVDGDDVRCRWAQSSQGECAGVCQAIPATLSSNCILRVNTGISTGLYAVALQIEDFVSTSSSVAMSSVPLQFLVSVYSSSYSCDSEPILSSSLEDDSVVEVAVGSLWHETILATSGSLSQSIVEIVTVSPRGLTKSGLEHIPDTLSWKITVSWTPDNSQIGPHIFCFYAIDNLGLSSVERCVTLKVKLSEILADLQAIKYHYLGISGAFPVQSCSDLADRKPWSESGEFWINPIDIVTDHASTRKVYCDLERNFTSTYGNGWMRVANLDMTNPTQNCPDGFRLYTLSKRLCGRHKTGCISTFYSTHGVQYRSVAGRARGYQLGTTDGFASQVSNNISAAYMDGVSVTHGSSPRKHIWSFVAGLMEMEHEHRHHCPYSSPRGVQPPSFVGNDFFFEAGSTRHPAVNVLYDDVLWDGKNCSGIEGPCCTRNPTIPWFYKELPQPTTDDIEVRICGNYPPDNEDVLVELLELYVQ